MNKTAKIILTISPVPLVASMENRHILSSNTASKSILRAAADSIDRAYNFVSYFPSFEIITGNFNLGQYYAEDLRSVRSEGVGHVMRLFINECTSSEHKIPVKAIKVNTDKLEILKKETDDLAKVICDEELLDDSKEVN